MDRIALVLWLLACLAISGCFDAVHQEYFTVNDLPLVPGKAFGKEVVIKRNPMDHAVKLLVIRDENGYHYFPLGADDSNFIDQAKNALGDIPKPIP